MAHYRINSHPVAASRIVGVKPLMGRNTELMSPDFGLTLVLEDETQNKWLCEKGIVPSVGDFLVHDTELNVTYVVTPTKFKKLFRKPKP
jgi:hypothetical protein